MSDEKIETGGGEATGSADSGGNPNDEPIAGDRNTNTNPPRVEGGQPAVGDDRPRNTEF